MPQAIHITTLKRMLQSLEPVDIKLWTRSGEIQCWHRCISLRYDFYKGTRRMKLLDSNEIRQLRDACVFEINGMEREFEIIFKKVKSRKTSNLQRVAIKWSPVKIM